MKKIFLSFFLSYCIFTFYQCQAPSSRSVQTAFYHWKTRLDINETEAAFAKQLESNTLYVKFFDIDINGKKAVPKATLQPENISGFREIIPTIFITNRTFKNIPETEITSLAQKTKDKIFHLLKAFPDVQITEIQFDCDWSESTRAAYFSFLSEFKKSIAPTALNLSATIRLHQIKYFERTGVPPVERGMLMFYNTGNLTDLETQNSILDLKTAEQYLGGFSEYPLDLDLALPLFRWGVLFRENKMVRLLNNLSEEEMQESVAFRQTKNNTYLVNEDRYLAGHYIYKGDKIRLESVSQKKIVESAQILSAIWQTDDFRLTFYHLDSMLIQQYELDTLFSLKRIFEGNGK